MNKRRRWKAHQRRRLFRVNHSTIYSMRREQATRRLVQWAAERLWPTARAGSSAG